MRINVFYILGLFVISAYILFNFNISREEEKKLATNMCYGYLNIDKIHLRKCLYEVNDENNSLDIGLEVYYLNPLVILGHSGTARNCYLNNLSEVKENDVIEIAYPNPIKYKVVKVYKKSKTELLKLANDLIIVTCDRNLKDMQIVVEAKKMVD